VRAILLVGGLGTRLRPLTENRPKALIPVLNRPFISYLLDHLKEAGVTDVVFAAGHLAEPIKRIFPTYSTKNFRLHFAEELRPLGTGGAIRFAFERFKHKNDPRPVLVFNGDVLFDLSLKRFNVFHRQKKSSCTIALKKVDNPAAFGVVETTRDGRIRTFVEKPHSYTDPSLINAGVYAIDPHLITSLPIFISLHTTSIAIRPSIALIMPVRILSEGDSFCRRMLKTFASEILTSSKTAASLLFTYRN
jgi:mannose-1-phosphate guanylyltransferase